MYRKCILERFGDQLPDELKKTFREAIGRIVWENPENPDFCMGGAVSDALEGTGAEFLADELGSRVMEFVHPEDMEALATAFSPEIAQESTSRKICTRSMIEAFEKYLRKEGSEGEADALKEVLEKLPGIDEKNPDIVEFSVLAEALKDYNADYLVLILQQKGGKWFAQISDLEAIRAYEEAHS